MALLSLKQMSPDAQALWLTNAIRKCEGCSTWTIKWNGDSFYEREEVFQCWDHEEHTMRYAPLDDELLAIGLYIEWTTGANFILCVD